MMATKYFIQVIFIAHNNFFLRIISLNISFSIPIFIHPDIILLKFFFLSSYSFLLFMLFLVDKKEIEGTKKIGLKKRTKKVKKMGLFVIFN